MNYNYIARFKFCLFLYPLVILARTPFNSLIIMFFNGFLFSLNWIKLFILTVTRYPWQYLLSIHFSLEFSRSPRNHFMFHEYRSRVQHFIFLVNVNTWSKMIPDLGILLVSLVFQVYICVYTYSNIYIYIFIYLEYC